MAFDWMKTLLKKTVLKKPVAVKKHLTPSLEALEDEQNSLFEFLEEAYMLSKLDSCYVNCLIGIG